MCVCCSLDDVIMHLSCQISKRLRCATGELGMGESTSVVIQKIVKTEISILRDFPVLSFFQTFNVSKCLFTGFYMVQD